MNIRKNEILQFLVSFLIILGVLYSLFKKRYIEQVGYDIYILSIATVIEDVYDYKDSNGPGIATKLQGYAIPFCFS